jgi:CRISPR-associated exonuclease Cas4
LAIRTEGSRKPEKSGADNFQLCAQALCLEEMFSTAISSGDIYYGKLRKRVAVPLTDSLKQKTEAIIREIHSLLASKHPQIPSRPENQNCRNCSLANICVPAIFDTKESNFSRIGKLLERGNEIRCENY